MIITPIGKKFISIKSLATLHINYQPAGEKIVEQMPVNDYSYSQRCYV